MEQNDSSLKDKRSLRNPSSYKSKGRVRIPKFLKLEMRRDTTIATNEIYRLLRHYFENLNSNKMEKRQSLQ
jgi:hypothetical protein